MNIILKDEIHRYGLPLEYEVTLTLPATPEVLVLIFDKATFNNIIETGETSKKGKYTVYSRVFLGDEMIEREVFEDYSNANEGWLTGDLKHYKLDWCKDYLGLRS